LVGIDKALLIWYSEIQEFTFTQEFTMGIDPLDIETLKNALRERRRRRRNLEHFIRPMGNELAKTTTIDIQLCNLLQTLGVNVNSEEFSKEIEHEPPELDINEVIDILAQSLPTKSNVPEGIGGITVANAAYLALQSVGHPVHYKEIVVTMKQKGFVMPGSDPESNLLAHMSNDKKRFAKAPEAGRGFWRLVEWDKGQGQGQG
jgi:hypothetical protein